MNRSLELELKVGFFVLLGLFVAMLTLFTIGGGSSLFQRSLHLKVKFNDIEGVVEGANVKLAGIKIGKIEKVNFLKNENKVELIFSIDRRYQEDIHKDGLVGVRTQGVLGDKFLLILPGSVQTPLVEDGAELHAETAKELKDYISSADELLDRLKGSMTHFQNILSSFEKDNRADIFFKNLSAFSSSANTASSDIKTSAEKLKSILTKIDGGQGTAGALINDPALYDDLRSLVGGANRSKVVRYFVRKSVENSKEAAAKKSEKNP